MRTREEVTALAAKIFPNHPPEEIQGYLDLYGAEDYERERERVQYDILKLCEGDLDRLLSLIDEAKRDYRDIIAAAEYPPMDRDEAQEGVKRIYKAFKKGEPAPDVDNPPKE